MSRSSSPWWASQDGTHGLEDVDPVEAFRAARRPSGAATNGTTAAGEEEGGTDSDGARTDPDGEDTAPGPHRPELCGICPLCSLARTLEDTRPELLEHLTEAARHLAAAARSLVEQPPAPRPGADRAPGDASTAGGGGAGVQRIPLGEQPDDRRPPRSGDDTLDAGDS